MRTSGKKRGSLGFTSDRHNILCSDNKPVDDCALTFVIIVVVHDNGAPHTRITAVEMLWICVDSMNKIVSPHTT